MKLTKYQADSLQELSNIGTGKATNKLSSLLKREVRMDIPDVKIIPIDKVDSTIGGPKKLVIGVFSKILKSVEGTICIVFPKKSALLFIDAVQKKKSGTTKFLSEKDILKLKKIGNALSKNYTDTIKMFLGIDIKCMGSNLVSTFGESLSNLILLGIKERQVMLLRTKFCINKPKIEGDFILLLAIKSMTKFLKALEKKKRV